MTNLSSHLDLEVFPSFRKVVCLGEWKKENEGRSFLSVFEKLLARRSRIPTVSTDSSAWDLNEEANLLKWEDLEATYCTSCTAG